MRDLASGGYGSCTLHSAALPRIDRLCPCVHHRRLLSLEPYESNQDRRYSRSRQRQCGASSAALIREGVDVFRINTAHGDREDTRTTSPRSARRKKAGQPVARPSGPRQPARCAEVPPRRPLPATRRHRPLCPGRSHHEPGRACLHLSERSLKNSTSATASMLADGVVAPRRWPASRPTRSSAPSSREGPVRDKQGVNLPGVKLSVASTERPGP